MGRPKKKESENKNYMLTMRLTEDQLAYLDAMMERITASTGFPVSRSNVAGRLMELGKSSLEREYPATRRK